MATIGRKVKRPQQQEINAINDEKQLTKIVIGDEVAVYRLKNIMPTGSFGFKSEDGDGIIIKAGEEFEVTKNELDNMINCVAFKEGTVIFCETYPDYDSVCNMMSDEKIKELLKHRVNVFEKHIKTIDSHLTLDRIKEHVLKANKSSGFLDAVNIHKQNLIDEYNQSQTYKTDEEINRESMIHSRI